MGIGPPGRCRSRTPWVWGCNWPTASTPHSAGILHRDINPANIFITDRGTAKLLDFGLARAQGAELDDAPTMDVTAAGTVMGTVAYMSPEQARGEQLDARSDLFSLGVVLYEMLTGRPVFTGNTSAVIFERIFNETLEPPPRGSIPAFRASWTGSCVGCWRSRGIGARRAQATSGRRSPGSATIRDRGPRQWRMTKSRSSCCRS
jgi:serine/threonine protein kinase